MKLNSLKIYILGKKSFIGTSLHNGILHPSHQIGVDDFIKKNVIEEVKDEKLESLIVIDASGVSRGSLNDFFEINLEQKLYLIHKLIEIRKSNEALEIKYIYFGSIHDHLENMYGYSKKFVEYLLKKHLIVNDIRCKIIKLCGIYGPGVKPYKYSVVGTFYHNISKNIKCEINNNLLPIPLAHVNEVINCVNKYINNSDKISINIETINGGNVYISDLHDYIFKLSKYSEFNSEEYVYNSLQNFIKGIK